MSNIITHEDFSKLPRDIQIIILDYFTHEIKYICWSICNNIDIHHKKINQEILLEYNPEYMKSLIHIFDDKTLIGLNAYYGNLENIKYLFEKKYHYGTTFEYFFSFPYDRDTVKKAIINGHYECTKWLLEHKFPHDTNTLNIAKLKYPEIYKLLLTYKHTHVSTDDETMVECSRNPNFINFDWMFELADGNFI